MEFKTYNPEEEDYLHEEFQSFLRPPENVEKYRGVIEEALNDAEEVLGVDSDVEVLFGLTDTEKVQETFGEEASANFYIHGFAFGSWMEGVDEDLIFVRANDYPEDWEDVLKNMTVHERMHLDLYSRNDDSFLGPWLENSMYSRVLLEGHAMNATEKVSREKDYSWRPHYRELGKASPNPESLRDELEKERSESSFFEPGGDEWENYDGYVISYEIGNWILENKGLDINDLPTLSEKKVRDVIDEAVDSLY